MVRVDILGPLRLERDGEPVELSGGRLRALLTRLALDAGRPAIAALDVYDDEPLTPGHALAARRDVVLSPHLGFVNDPVFSLYGPGVTENLLAWLDGKPLPRPALP